MSIAPLAALAQCFSIAPLAALAQCRLLRSLRSRNVDCSARCARAMSIAPLAALAQCRLLRSLRSRNVDCSARCARAMSIAPLAALAQCRLLRSLRSLREDRAFEPLPSSLTRRRKTCLLVRSSRTAARDPGARCVSSKANQARAAETTARAASWTSARCSGPLNDSA